MSTTPTRPSRGTAILYDQHLRLLASHYSNMHQGRSNSAAYVANYFHELLSYVAPTLFVEAGAFRAEASRRVRQEHPRCRVVAFEANTYNHRQFVDEFRFAELGVEYLNLALTDRAGEVTFHLRTQQDGQQLRKVTDNSSLLVRHATDTSYEEVRVAGTTLDEFFPELSDQERVALWVDVEGASGQVLRGGRRLLERTQLVIIEVEEATVWEGQWRSLDVIEFFLDNGFVPLTRDAEFNQQYNIVMVSQEFYARPEVLWSHELHTNYLTQHMGVRGPAT
jgi:FkbM family methyltransferase